MSIAAEFIKVDLTGVPEQKVDELSGYLFEIKAQGVSEKLNFIQTSQQYDPEILEKDFVDLEVFFGIGDLEQIQSHVLIEPLSEFAPKVNIEKNKDWLEEWKKHYSAFQVEDHLWVYPSWEAKSVQEGQLALLVDPGLAFGTGTHATTDLCMCALFNILKSPKHSHSSALDMGAGTGILSVLIKKLGVSSVLACEIDEMARVKCQENLALNSVSDVDVVAPSALDDSSRFSLVVANIIDGVLLQIKEQLYKATDHTLVLSGILLENEDEVTKEFLNLGFKLSFRSSKEEWACLVLQKVK